MATEIKAFKCDWCSRCFTRRNNAETHEAACKNNPERRQCITCVHGTVDLVRVVREDDGYSRMEYSYHTPPYCAIHKEPIHKKPYFIDCDLGGGYDTGFGWIEERPIPGTCEYYEYKGKPGWTRRERKETQEEQHEPGIVF